MDGAVLGVRRHVDRLPQRLMPRPLPDHPDLYLVQPDRVPSGLGGAARVVLRVPGAAVPPGPAGGAHPGGVPEGADPGSSQRVVQCGVLSRGGGARTQPRGDHQGGQDRQSSRGTGERGA